MSAVTVVNAASMMCLAVVSGTASGIPGQASEREKRPPDQSITESVEREFTSDYLLRDADITVRTVVGGVVLTGTVASYADKRRAGRLCQKIHGVRSISNRLKVETLAGTDAEIARAIKRRWLEDSLLRFQNLKVAVDNGVITLEGAVRSPIHKKHAERLAHEVRGVLLVRNELEVDAVAAKRAPALTKTTTLTGADDNSDNAVKSRIQKLFDRDAGLIAMPIQLAVSGGSVTLTGVVENLQLQRRAATRASSVPGVTQVDNQLRVASESELMLLASHARHPDTQLAHDVSTELRRDAGIDSTGITLDVNDGVATVLGTVPSMYQKVRTTWVTRRVAGVLRVNNKLIVDDEPRADAEIQLGIEEALATDSVLASDRVTVSVNKAVITLSGAVDNIARKKRARLVAARVPGVASILNHIGVNWEPRFTDTELEKLIHQRLRANTTTRQVSDEIDIAVSGGCVTLTGTVSHWQQQRGVVRIAESTDGVRSVSDELRRDATSLSAADDQN